MLTLVEMVHVSGFEYILLHVLCCNSNFEHMRSTAQMKTRALQSTAYTPEKACH